MRDYVIHDVKSLLYKGIFLWKKKQKKKAPKSPDFEEKKIPWIHTIRPMSSIKYYSTSFLRDL
jgi:hypothetical protein